MPRRSWLLFTVLVLVAGSATAQNVQSVLQTTAIAMGMESLTSIRYSGTGWRGRVGQNVSPDRDWPRVELTSYTRTIDFETMSSKEEYVLEQGGRATNLVAGDHAWALDAQGQSLPQPALAEVRRLEILLTPWGFIKGAMAPGANPTMVTRQEYGGRSTVISFVAFGKYRVNGTINPDGMLERVQTWVPNPVVGDMYYENVYTQYREVGGVQIPRFHQHQDYDDGANTPNVSGGDHAFGLETFSELEANVANAALTAPADVQRASVPPVRVDSQRLADGVWLIGGGSHHSVVVEFSDHVVVIEAPLNEARSLAVIGEVYRVIPDKPIRFIVTTHHHWDHLGGLRAYVHEGATVVTHESNKPYYQEVLRAGPWLLEPDRLSLYPPEEWSEGYIFETLIEKSVLADQTRMVEVHNLPGLAHAAGMLIAYLPSEKILIQADLHSSQQQAPNASSRTLLRALQQLELDVETIVGIHGSPVSLSDFVEFVGGGR
ncbi:MAG: MBL fold metallo-hydrolase [Acidobacteriota bacterium]|nr:MBL fold metallo-hydrolase [Acidobacteriota bacterium]